MKTAPIFSVCNASQPVKNLLKGADGILRIFQFDRAPEKITAPYAIWQVISGSPENYLACRPDIEGHTIQLNVYAASASQAQAVLSAIEYAIEKDCHVVTYHSEQVDKDTNEFTVGLDADWYVKR